MILANTNQAFGAVPGTALTDKTRAKCISPFSCSSAGPTPLYSEYFARRASTGFVILNSGMESILRGGTQYMSARPVVKPPMVNFT
jgi:hypothetical protein